MEEKIVPFERPAAAPEKDPTAFASKMQWLVGNHPAAAKEVEKMLDWLRARLERQRS